MRRTDRFGNVREPKPRGMDLVRPLVGPAPIAASLTTEQEKTIEHAAQRVWEEIGYDVLNALAEAGEGTTVDRDDVIELVLDASRLEEMLRRTKADAFVLAFVGDYTSEKKMRAVKRILRRAFPYGAYGM